jgi:hypothetical protein
MLDIIFGLGFSFIFICGAIFIKICLACLMLIFFPIKLLLKLIF